MQLLGKQYFENEESTDTAQETMLMAVFTVNSPAYFVVRFKCQLEMNACLPGCVWNATPRYLSPLERNIGFWTQA